MLRAIVALMIAALLPSAAHAEKRVALLIGNQSYTSEIGRLANPHNDIALLEKALKGLQFEVTSVRDASLGGMHQAVNAYARRVKAAGPGAVAFFYYAGHGAADAGTNYLIPVDVKSAEEGDLWDVSLRLTEITRKLKAEAGNATHFVVFDACRNNLKLRKAGSRALIESRGFVPVSQESGMLVAYATAEGELASDVGVGAGPYSSMLAEEIVKPGVEAVTMFRNVQRRVRAAIKQEPYLGFNALGDVYLAGLAPDAPKSAAAPAPAPGPARQSEAAEAWASVKDSTDVRDLEAYRRQYGQSNPFYDRQAERRIEELKKQTAAAAPPPAAKPALAPLVETVVGLLSPSRAPRPLTAAEERALKPKDSFKECDDCPEMVVVPAGSFTMGSNPAEIAALEKQYSSDLFRSEGPQRKVTIARPFAVGKFEVTFAEWDACIAGGGCTGNKNPSDEGWGKGRRPVIRVSWDDAKEYVAWLSSKTGKTYRLLTEAEWEYAARGVTSASTPSKRYWWGDLASHEYANYGKDQCCGGRKEGRDEWENTAPVGQFPANAFGLHDMHGNVWEWVEDCWHDSYQGAPTDGSAWTISCTDSGRRVLRGGSWSDLPGSLRSASRDRGTAGFRYNGVGFRVGRTLTP